MCLLKSVRLNLEVIYNLVLVVGSGDAEIIRIISFLYSFLIQISLSFELCEIEWIFIM